MYIEMARLTGDSMQKLEMYKQAQRTIKNLGFNVEFQFFKAIIIDIWNYGCDLLE